MSSNDDDYEVGYKKPPKANQFKKGQSGNKNGRPKGVRNFKTEVKEVAQEKVPVKLKGTTKKVSTRLAVLMRLREKALQGDFRAMLSFLDLAGQVSAEQEDRAAEKELGKHESEILDRLFSEIQSEELEDDKA